MNPFFENKAFLVTGASSGIGKAIAIELANSGATVGVIARRKENLKELKSLVKDPNLIIILPADVSAESEVKKVVEEFKKKAKRVDGLIHNAGVSMRALASEADMKVFRNLMDINYFPLVHFYKLLESDLKQSDGHLVAVSSIQGKFATQFRSGYAASKHAIQGFMDSVRLENAKTGMHVLTVCPGFVKTEISIKALSADGSPHGIMDEGQKKGLETNKVAKKILKAIEKRKRDLYPAGLKEKFALLLSKFAPKTLDKVLLKTRVT
ncbi:short chain dehydrogenase [Leptospira perolatii]|uniref:Short chain dehydrogenase n=2 Tax=Leptospira perolatii TaxID=2023191 RepID=A0A2M9ZL73_9LEPT|nr:short chain dehydrogenase [Leptospira perolatii]PJZ72693.1 short chain dehydrogenase [Leptospira perolatii]